MHNKKRKNSVNAKKNILNFINNGYLKIYLK